MKKEPLTLVHFKQWLPVRPQNSYKGDYGRALLIGGNRQMGGAVQMNAQAAVYAGCGLVTVASDKANLQQFTPRFLRRCLLTGMILKR